jgi:hypothetical protein
MPKNKGAEKRRVVKALAIECFMVDLLFTAVLPCVRRVQLAGWSFEVRLGNGEVSYAYVRF